MIGQNPFKNPTTNEKQRRKKEARKYPTKYYQSKSHLNGLKHNLNEANLN